MGSCVCMLCVVCVCLEGWKGEDRAGSHPGSSPVVMSLCMATTWKVVM